MDSFFLPLVTAALAEWGDKTQLLALLLAVRFQKPVLVLVAVACAAALNSVITAYAGFLIGEYIDDRAALLFLALGFAFAGAGAMIRVKDPDNGLKWKLGAFLTTFLAFFIVEFGDKTQFLTAGYAAVLPLWPFVAVGATIGITLGCAPAIMMGEVFRKNVPLKLVRRIIGGVFLLVAAALAINVFALI